MNEVSFSNVKFGATSTIRFGIIESDAEAFTITNATVCITNADTGAVVVAAGTAASYSNTTGYVWYRGTWTAGNGFAEGGKYRGTFRVTIGSDQECFEGDFIVEAVADQ